jgi:Protein of unknown function (DUF3037)
MMAHIYEFAILTAVPDARRGERVNVGIIIFMPDRLDVRLSEVGKLRALKEGRWEDHLTTVRTQLMREFSEGESAPQFLKRAAMVEDVISFSEVSWFSIDREEQFEERVNAILTSLVTRPRGEVKPRVTQINSEIASTFRAAKVLATPTDTIESDRKIFRNFTISQEEELRADFILKNGAFHVMVTLDLRRVAVNVGQAALKAITLDKSTETLRGSVRKIAIYAAPSGAQQFRPHVGILTDYADRGHIFNWLDPDQRGRYTRMVYDAINGPHSFQLGIP